MKKTIMNKWVKALRSGKYSQCKENLCTIDTEGNSSYCCLGVLTQLYLDERKKQKKGNNIEGFITAEEYNKYLDWVDTSSPYPAWFINDETGLLPEEVARWAGIDTKRDGWGTGSIDGFPEDKSLATMNDGWECAGMRRKTFKEIANIIEKNYDKI
jgi:hypothetical protein